MNQNFEVSMIMVKFRPLSEDNYKHVKVTIQNVSWIKVGNKIYILVAEEDIINYFNIDLKHNSIASLSINTYVFSNQFIKLNPLVWNINNFQSVGSHKIAVAYLPILGFVHALWVGFSEFRFTVECGDGSRELRHGMQFAGHIVQHCHYVSR